MYMYVQFTAPELYMYMYILELTLSCIDRLQSTPSWLIFQTHGNQKASIPYFWSYWATGLKINIHNTLKLTTK